MLKAREIAKTAVYEKLKEMTSQVESLAEGLTTKTRRTSQPGVTDEGLKKKSPNLKLQYGSLKPRSGEAKTVKLKSLRPPMEK